MLAIFGCGRVHFSGGRLTGQEDSLEPVDPGYSSNIMQSACSFDIESCHSVTATYCCSRRRGGPSVIQEGTKSRVCVPFPVGF